MRRLALAAALTLAACSSAKAPAGRGQPCGASQGCQDGLICHAGTCDVPSGAASSSGDSGSSGATTGASASSSSTGASTSASTTGASTSGTTGASTSGTTGASTSGTTSGSGSTGASGTTTTGTTGGCGPCTSPPDDCHATVGTCQAGVCVYDFVEGASCDDGNPCTLQDTCHNGACAGTSMVCDTPPAAACIAGDTLSTYDAQGSCQAGRCIYTSHTVTCSGACVGGACQTDPCASVSCTTPPSACFVSTGTCSNGQCSYAYDDGATCDDGNACTTGDQCNTGVCKGTPVACTTPPASTCSNSSTLKVYQSVGSCSAASGSPTCSYSYNFVTCANGCSNGACNGSGWTKMTSNSNADLYAVWGSSANDVWAVGKSGTALHYNGVQWSAKSSNVLSDLMSIHGLASSDVYAVCKGTWGPDVIHYDGGTWGKVTGDLALDYDGSAAIFEASPGHPWVAGSYGSGDYVAIAQVFPDGGSDLSYGAYGFVYALTSGVWAFPSGDVWGSNTTVCSRQGDGGCARISGSIYGTGAIWATSEQDAFVAADGNVAHWDGSAFTVLNTGFTGTISGLSGTASSRVFASGYDNASPSVGYVLFWDGSGWTQATLPAGTAGLKAIWAAPTGQVFAVGNGGTILEGP